MPNVLGPFGSVASCATSLSGTICRRNYAYAPGAHVTDVFISYNSEERAHAKALYELLEQRGLNVWWDDRLLAGDRFADEIQSVIERCRAVVVLWSEQSVTSDWVRDEAALARRQGIIVPARVDACSLPLSFNSLHTLDLTGWDGRPDDPRLPSLIDAVQRRLVRAPEAPRTPDEVESHLHSADVEVEHRRATKERAAPSAEEHLLYQHRYGEDVWFSYLAQPRAERLEPNSGDVSTSGRRVERPRSARIVVLLAAAVALTGGFFAYLTQRQEVLGYLGFPTSSELDRRVTSTTERPTAAPLTVGRALAVSANNCLTQYEYQVEVTGRFGEIDRNVVFVIAENTPVLHRPETDAAAVGTVSFNDSLELMGAVSDTRHAEVRLSGQGLADDSVSGWVALDHLLCGTEPLSLPNTALERKILVRTEDAITGEVRSVPTYLDPTEDTCRGSCTDLARADRFFVYDQTDDFDLASRAGRLLISAHHRLDGAAPLVGWVDASHVMPWNTAVAVRGADTIGDWSDGGQTVCFYTSIEEAEDPNQDPTLCERQYMASGSIWFSRTARLPLLREMGEYYELALVTRADPPMLGDNNGSGQESEGSFEEVVQAMRFVDVFFVIDGTESMGAAIEAIRGPSGNDGIVATVIDNLNSGFGDRGGTSFRFGFQVYRDSIPEGRGVAPSDGIDEGFSLPAVECGEHDPRRTEHGGEMFQEAFDVVEARSYPSGLWDDYTENIYGGLVEAARRMATCGGEHRKIVIVLGDHGYNPDRQLERGFRAWSASEVAASLLETTRDQQGDLHPELLQVVFFQIPNKSATLPSDRHASDYDRSYLWFRRNALEVLADLGVPADTEDEYFIRLDGPDSAARVADTIVDLIVNQVALPQRVGEIEARLAAGRSLEQILAEQNTNDPPTIFLVPLEIFCRETPEYCRAHEIDLIREIYIHKSEPIEFDVLMTGDDLRNFIDLGQAVGRVDMNSDYVRNALATALHQSVLAIAREPIETPIAGFAEALNKRIGLPSDVETPLLRYSIDDILNADQCELELVRRWIIHSAEALEIISGSIRASSEDQHQLGVPVEPQLSGDWPVFMPDPVSHELCRFTEPGTLLPSVIGVTTDPLGDTADYQFGYESRQHGTTFYWVPIEYLP